MSTKASPKVHGKDHDAARDLYLSQRGPEARRRRAAEREAVRMDFRLWEEELAQRHAPSS